MNFLSAEQISKSFGEKLLFSNVSFGIQSGQKVALIAKNGAGKSSLLKIILGQDTPDSGRISLRSDIKIAYLEQNPQFDPAQSTLQVLFNDDNDFIRAIRNYELISTKMSVDHSPEVQKEFERAVAMMDAQDAWNYETKAREILGKFDIHDLNQLIGELSGGQKKKIALAKALIENADFLILDEPTNHLDIVMIEWLEEYLSRQNLALLIVTHDRYFLDNVCNEIFELDNKTLYQYKGNYTYFLEKKAERELIEDIEHTKLESYYNRELDWIRRSPQARTTKSKSRVESFYELEDKMGGYQKQKTTGFNVVMERLGGKILELNNVTRIFDGKTVIDDFSHIFKRGERIGVMGKNGSGKTTLLNIIAGFDKPTKGRIVRGQTVMFGYFTQDGIEADDSKRIIDLVKEIAEEIPVKKGSLSASQFLTYFGFDHQMQYSYYSKLSGGERRKLSLLMTLMQNPNFLILDEPTNDLDIKTLNLLEDFLQNFEGCLLIVSHDRYFIDRISEHIFVFGDNGKIKDFWGNYSEYHIKAREQEKIDRIKSALAAGKKSSAPDSPPKPKSEKSVYKLKIEYQQLEEEIITLETEQTELIERMNSGSLNARELEDISRRIAEIIKELEVKSDRWLELGELFN